MKTLLLFLSLLIPVSLFGQAVSRAELRATNNAILARALPTNTVVILTNTGAGIQAAWNANPTDTKFILPGGTYQVSSTITNPIGAKRCWFLGTVKASSWPNGGVTLLWTGATNGTIMKLDCADSITLENIGIETTHTNSAAKGLVCDQTALGGGTMTELLIKNCYIGSKNTNRLHHFIAHEVSPTAASNNEHFQWIDTVFVGFGLGWAKASNNSFGLVFGNNANIKNMRWVNGSFNYFTNAICMTNGAFEIEDAFSTGSSLDLNALSWVDHLNVRRWRSESYRQFAALGGSTAPVWFDGISAQDETSWETAFALIELNGYCKLSASRNNFGSGAFPSQPQFSLSGGGLDSHLEVNQDNRWTTNDSGGVMTMFVNYPPSKYQDAVGFYNIIKQPLRWFDGSHKGTGPTNLITLNTNTGAIAWGGAGANSMSNLTLTTPTSNSSPVAAAVFDANGVISRGALGSGSGNFSTNSEGTAVLGNGGDAPQLNLYSVAAQTSNVVQHFTFGSTSPSFAIDPVGNIVSAQVPRVGVQSDANYVVANNDAGGGFGSARTNKALIGTNGIVVHHSGNVIVISNAITGLILDYIVVLSNTVNFAAIAWTNADLNLGATRWVQTNSMAGNQFFAVTNIAGTTNSAIHFVIEGEAAGGSTRYVTNTVDSIGGTIPVLLRNGSSAAQASPLVWAVPAGTVLEGDIEFTFQRGTNFGNALTNLYTR